MGGIRVRKGLNIDGMGLIFMKVHGNRLDPATALDSNWVGNRTGGQEMSVSGNGAIVLGIRRRQGPGSRLFRRAGDAGRTECGGARARQSRGAARAGSDAAGNGAIAAGRFPHQAQHALPGGGGTVHGRGAPRRRRAGSARAESGRRRPRAVRSAARRGAVLVHPNQARAVLAMPTASQPGREVLQSIHARQQDQRLGREYRATGRPALGAAQGKAPAGHQAEF